MNTGMKSWSVNMPELHRLIRLLFLATLFAYGAAIAQGNRPIDTQLIGAAERGDAPREAEDLRRTRAG